MKKTSLSLLILVLTACSKEPNVAVRIDCGDYNDKGLQATLNGQPVGDCPVDIMVHAGEVNVSARKDNEDASYLFAEEKMTLAENAMKRIKLDIQPLYTEEYYYRKATDITGMQAYLEKQPAGKRREDIIVKIEKYYFDKTSDLAGMQLYLKELPDGKRFSEVNDKIEQYYFDKAVNEDGIQQYLDNLADGKRRLDVVQKLADLKKKAADEKQKLAIENEQKLFNNAKDPAGMVAYLTKLPHGKRRNEVVAMFLQNIPMVDIPAGNFTMGCIPGENKESCDFNQNPHRVVSISKFRLAKTEVTFAQYELFARTTNRSVPSDNGFGTGQKPVINVNWFEAAAYADWLTTITGRNFRLPSEAEWEYACRAGGRHLYCGSNDINSIGWYDDNSGGQTHEVAKKQPNSFGLYDMTGNVWEWTQDCYREYFIDAPLDGSAWGSAKDCHYGVIRGRSWHDPKKWSTAAARSRFNGDKRWSHHTGFRVAMTL